MTRLRFVGLFRPLIDGLLDSYTFLQVLGEMHRIMVEGSYTKDVFRELDGYLLVVNVISILHAYLEKEDADVVQIEEGERLAFMLLAESFNRQPANERYFEVCLLTLLWSYPMLNEHFRVLWGMTP